LKAGDKIAAGIHKGGCNMPTVNDAVLSVGLGTGIAPIRSL